ncbi:hypothetical protein Q5762_06315 [Streptomyces sp. P9(2023)]|uniref:hypothetical protein n=1 Tax=Streptomyces sp. P9(2023) TaxID=3064394 RepID=UPI0028F447F7|nr:hypothetical protein [Streptomyces sp. P9(2023)]MDT9687973.1 hypothetical protein [Streptomyces sp. P9(2023)]
MAEQQDGEREPQPIDEEAAWAAIVAGYGDEPADPPGAKPFRSVEDLALPEPVEDDADGDSDSEDSDEEDSDEDDEDDRPAKPALGSSIVFAPGVGVGVGGGGPRDYSLADPDAESDSGEAGEAGEAAGKKAGKKRDDDGEGHFVPPEPPPLPEADATTKFAWLGVVGGPLLMLLAVLLQWDMTWWLSTVCVGGFLGGFATLVARMKHDDEDDDGYDDPGRGAVV